MYVYFFWQNTWYDQCFWFLWGKILQIALTGSIRWLWLITEWIRSRKNWGQYLSFSAIIIKHIMMLRKLADLNSFEVFVWTKKNRFLASCSDTNKDILTHCVVQYLNCLACKLLLLYWGQYVISFWALNASIFQLASLHAPLTSHICCRV